MLTDQFAYPIIQITSNLFYLSHMKIFLPTQIYIYILD